MSLVGGVSLDIIYFIQSDNHCLLIGLFIPFIFNAIINIIGLMSAISLLVFCVPLVFFVPLYLLYCLLFHEVKIFSCSTLIYLMFFFHYFFNGCSKAYHIHLNLLELEAVQIYNNLISVRYRNITFM